MTKRTTTASEKSDKTDTWMPLLVAKYLADTMHLSTEQHGGYLLLLMHGWMNSGVLPVDDEKLRRITRMSPKSWAEQKDDLMAFFTEQDGVLRQKRLDAELTRWGELKAQKSAAGKASAAKRAAQQKEQQEGNTRSTDVQRAFNERSTEHTTELATEPPTEFNPTPSPIPLSSFEVCSEAGASGADAPPKPLTAKDRVWLHGVAVLGEKGRSLLGKLSATYGDEVVADVLSAAIAEKPVEPKAWVTAGCEARAKAKPAAGKPSGPADNLALLNRDPRPKWLEPTGYANIFEAENDGCREHSAHLFRDGKRVPA